MAVHVLGIRHHGPGSARSLRAALEQLQPDAVLIEGPPDADTLIPLAAHADTVPPVALLVYTPDDTQQAAYYPFAVFSPEYQAIRWALANEAHVQFMDLPQAHSIALHREQIAQPDEEAVPVIEGETPQPDADTDADKEVSLSEQVKRDPLGWLGRAAGYEDGERWWEHIIEQRRDDLSGVFEAVLEAMTALREAAGTELDPNEARREAYMRKTLRKAQREGYDKIAVVCGAWHAPALVEGSPFYRKASDDNATLRGMPKVKVEATWIPWTYGRLSRESGYGAGIESPGWYNHLWHTDNEIVTRWFSRVASLLREEDLDASTAQIIDAVRLAEAITSIRGYALPSLIELNESIRATMTFGADSPMELIHQQLIVGERIGEVPPETPMVPLQRDLKDTIKRLKGGRSKKNGSYFQQYAEATPLQLDLRTPTHLERSQLLHRLRLLGVKWGKPARSEVRGKGTFHEDWTLQWQPDYEIKLIEQSVWGNTIVDAAAAYLVYQAAHADNLPALTTLVEKALNADLPQAFDKLIAQLKAKASVASDMDNLMDALPPLVYVKYGNVRGIDLSDITAVIDGLVTRITIGLGNACASLDDDAADAMHKRIVSVHDAVLRLQDDAYTAAWLQTLKQLASSDTVHGLVAGRAARLLLDMQALDAANVATLMRLAISTAKEPPAAAAWVEGFLRGSGLILLHDDDLFGVIDRWVLSLTEDSFRALLPLLRRTFATFSRAERRQIGERVRHQLTTTRDNTETQSVEFDERRADAVMPTLALLLGLEEETS